jgi:hypothetical protein
MLQADDVTILEELQLAVWVVFRRFPSGKDSPMVVVIFVVIASDLLLA